MIVQGLILAFLGAWLANEYMNNIYMQLYFNSVIGAHLITYTMLIGLVIGLGGTATAFTLWKNLRETRVKLEHISSPRLRGSVRKALSVLPTMDEETALEPRHSPSERSSTAIIHTPQTSAPLPQNQPANPLPLQEPQDKQP